MFLGVRDTSDYSVTGGGGKEGVRNDNGGICTAEMEKKCFSFCHHVIPIPCLPNAPCEFLRLNFKIKLFF